LRGNGIPLAVRGRRLLRPLLAGGVIPTDSEDERLRKATLTSISAMTALAGIIWAGTYWMVGLPLVAAIPFGYSLILCLAIAHFFRTKSYRAFRTIQLILILALPFLVQWTLGGFTAASAVMIWALLSPMGALMFAGVGQATLLFAAFLALTVLSGLLDPVLARHAAPLPPGFISAFFVLNFAGVATIVYVLLQYFMHQRARAQERSEALLLNILPAPIADRLKNRPGVIADSFNDVTILFADIVNFTSMAAALTPAQVISLLDDIFSAFDALVERHRLEKIKTIGDAYMVVGGLPEPRSDHATATAEMALGMIDAVGAYRHRTHIPVHVRIGMNTGPVTAGVIGRRKFIYDIWGDAVNVASRMESSGLADVIQTTESTFALLNRAYDFEERADVDVKGKGRVTTYLLRGRKGATAPA
jgi:class 3 adenylate cyclase